MGISLSHLATTTHEITAEDRMERLAELTPAQRGDAPHQRGSTGTARRQRAQGLPERVTPRPFG